MVELLAVAGLMDALIGGWIEGLADWLVDAINCKEWQVRGKTPEL